MFLANQAFAEILRAEGVDGDASIGLSLGEYNHLLHIGALAFDDALRLVAARGAAYDQGPLGAMGAVFPVEEAAVLDAIERSRALGSVEIANFNSPSQFVVAGDRAAVDAVLAILGDGYAAAGVIIDERLPMHCSLFAEVADRFRPALAAATIGVPRTAYVPNVLGRLLDAAAPSRIRHLLVRHVHQPVRFRQGVEALAERYPGAAFVEVGPKQVIYGLLTKKWGGFRRFRTDVGRDRHRHLHRSPGARAAACCLTTGRPGRVPSGSGPCGNRRRPRSASLWGAASIQRLIPHRAPFLLLDEVTALDVAQHAARARRSIDPHDPVFEGHFPGDPVYPGVLQIEMAGQLGVWLTQYLSGAATARALADPGL